MRPAEVSGERVDPAAGRPGPSSLIGKTVWTSAASVSSSMTAALSIVAVSRILGADGAGRVAYAVWVAPTAAQVALLALPQVALRFLAAGRASEGVAGWLVRRGFSLAPLGVLGAVAVVAASGESPAMVFATGLLALSASCAALGQSLLAGAQETRRLAVLSAWAAVLQLAATIGGSVIGGAVGGVAGHVAVALPFLSAVRERFRDRGQLEPAVLERLRSYALHTWIAMTASLIAWSRLEFVFLQARGPGAVAVYAVAVAISQMGLQPATLLGSALIPHFGELVSGEHTETSTQTFAAVTRVAAFVSLPFCFGLAALAPGLVAVMFGAPFRDAAIPAAVLLAASGLVAVSPAATAVTYALERTRYLATVTVGSAVVAAFAFLAVVPRFGVVGAALVRGTVHAGAVLVAFWYVGRKLGVRAPVGAVSRAAMAAMVSAAAGGLVGSALLPQWLAVIAGAATVALVYALVVRWMRVLEVSDVSHLDRVILARLPGAAGRALRRGMLFVVR